MPESANFIEGKNIILRPISKAHITDTYLSWLQDEEVMEGIATTGYTIDSLRTYVNQRINHPNVSFFAIHSKTNGEHIGNIKLDFFDAKTNVSELGLLIGDKTYWGKGIGYEACHLMIGYGFNVLGLRKIFLAVFEPNVAARKIYEKLGFKIEGRLRKHIAIRDKYFDKFLMGIFKEEFK